MSMSNLSYNELKEAFERTEKLKGEYSKMDVLRLQPGDVVVAYFNLNKIDIEQAVDMHNALTSILPKEISVVSIPDDCTQLLAYGKKCYTEEMFSSMESVLGREDYIRELRDELDRLDGDDLK